MRVKRFRLKKVRRVLPSLKDTAIFVFGALIACAVFGVIHLIHNAQTPLPYRAAGITSTWIPATVKRWEAPIDQMAQKYDIDSNAVAIIMTLESGGYANANSGEADGLMQITPLTAKDIASKYLKTPVNKYNLWNPQTNIEFGVAYLAYLRDQFGDVNQGPSWNSTMELIAAGYNGGPGAANSLDEGIGLQDTQTVVYSRDAFNMWRERNASSSPTYTRWLERGGSQLIDLAQAQK